MPWENAMRRRTMDYDASADAARWPDWRIGPSPLIVGRARETIIPAIKTIGIAIDLWEADQEWWTAHATYHLDYHGDNLARLTSDDEQEAAWAASLRVGRDGPRECQTSRPDRGGAASGS